MSLNSQNEYSYDKSMCSKFLFKNCTFINSGPISFILNGSNSFDNCIIKDVTIGTYNYADFILGVFNFNIAFSLLDVTNTIFENIKIENGYHLIALSLTITNLSNNSFINCFTNDNGIISANYIDAIQLPELFTFKNNTFQNIDTLFHLMTSSLKIDGIHIKNCETKSINPLIDISSDPLKTNLYINNGIFENIKLKINSLIGEEANYKFDNIKLINITAVSKPIFYAMRKNFIFTNIEIKDIHGNGDSLDSTLFYFDSDLNTSSFSLINVTISNCQSNNPLIKINGENINNINLLNVTINDSKSYGPIIENNSKN
eukprot:jgi/Orpsp1_1/1185727/evm.model.c7180000094966.1